MIAPLKRMLLLAIALAGLSGCERAPEVGGPQYAAQPAGKTTPIHRFAVHPLHNPAKLQAAYQPLVDHLNRHIEGVRFELEASRDYGVYENKLRAREPEFLLPNPWQTLLAMQAGYGVIAMAGDAADFKGIFLVRRDSNIRQPTDLKGKAVSYPAPTALAASIMPQYLLHTQGVDVMKDIDNRYVGSQDSSIMHVYLGKVAAAATWPPPWRAFQKSNPGEAAELKLIWETPPLLNNSVMARDDVPVEIRERLRQALLRLHDTVEGQSILAGMETTRFHPAGDADYAVVRDYVARFEREVRPIETPR